MTPTVNKVATTLLAMAFEAAPRLGVDGLMILPEGPIDWEDVRAAAPELKTMVAVSSPKAIEAVRGAGLIAVEDYDANRVGHKRYQCPRRLARDRGCYRGETAACRLVEHIR